jgi:arylsulfatase A-like enzyme
VRLHSRGRRAACQGARPPAAALAGAAGIALAAGLALLDAACAGTPRPNVVLIVFDTARADRFAWSDGGRDVAPRLAALARDATVYTEAWSPAPWTVPAHASLFTGRYPSAHRTDCGGLRLPDGEITLAEILRDAGYRTAGYTANPWLGNNYNFQQGFDTWGETWREVRDGDPDTGATLNNERVARFLDWWRDDPLARRQPFFLFVNYFEAHLPYRPPEPERARRLRPGADPERVVRLARLGHPDEMRFILGLSALTPEDLGILGDLYDGEIAYVDRRVGEVVDLLRGAGVLDRTVLAIVADHGENLGEHGLLDHKMSVHATLLRVPLLLRYPPRVAAGARIAVPVQTHDLFPTILGLVGVPPPAGAAVEAVALPGAGLRGAGRPAGVPMIGEVAGPPVEFLQTMKEKFPSADLARFDRTQVSFSRGGWTLHWGSDGRHALYDIRADAGESRDLAAAEAGRRNEMAAEVERWLRRPIRAAGPSPGAPARARRRRRRLRRPPSRRPRSRIGPGRP